MWRIRIQAATGVGTGLGSDFASGRNADPQSLIVETLDSMASIGENVAQFSPRKSPRTAFSASEEALNS